MPFDADFAKFVLDQSEHGATFSFRPYPDSDAFHDLKCSELTEETAQEERELRTRHTSEEFILPTPAPEGMVILIVGSGYTVRVIDLENGYELTAATSFVPRSSLTQEIDAYLSSIGAGRTTPWERAPDDDHVWHTTTATLSLEDFIRAAGASPPPTDYQRLLRERRKYWRSVFDQQHA